MTGIMPPDPDDEQEKVIEEVRKTMESFENDCRKVGIYIEGFVSGTAPGHPSAHDEEDEGGGQFVMATFLVGEQVFSDRVMNPERHEEDTKFRNAVGTIDPAADIKEQIEKNLREGKGIFDD